MSKWGTFRDILERIGPVVLASNPKTAPIAPVVVHAIAEAHAIQGSGAEKKAHAMTIVIDAVNVAHNAGVKGFEDPPLLFETVSQGIDAVVDAAKVIEGTKQAA